MGTVFAEDIIVNRAERVKPLESLFTFATKGVWTESLFFGVFFRIMTVTVTVPVSVACLWIDSATDARQDCEKVLHMF